MACTGDRCARLGSALLGGLEGKGRGGWTQLVGMGSATPACAQHCGLLVNKRPWLKQMHSLPLQAELCQTRPNVHRIRLNSGMLRPSRVNYNLNSPELGRTRLHSSRARPQWGKFRPILAKSGPESAEFGSTLARFGADFDWIGLDSAKVQRSWPNFDQCGSTWTSAISPPERTSLRNRNAYSAAQHNSVWVNGLGSSGERF